MHNTVWAPDVLWVFIHLISLYVYNVLPSLKKKLLCMLCKLNLLRCRFVVRKTSIQKHSKIHMYAACINYNKLLLTIILKLPFGIGFSFQYLTDCESGCQCPTGLLDDGRGYCVEEHECPCKHNDHFYTPGSQITDECNKWYVLFGGYNTGYIILVL